MARRAAGRGGAGRHGRLRFGGGGPGRGGASELAAGPTALNRCHLFFFCPAEDATRRGRDASAAPRLHHTSAPAYTYGPVSEAARATPTAYLGPLKPLAE